MLRPHSQFLQSGVIAADVALSGFVLFLLLSYPFASGVTEGESWALTPPLLATALCACLVWPLCLRQFGLYDSQRRADFDSIVGRLAGAAATATLLLMATSYVTSAPLAPKFSLLFGGVQFSLLLFGRMALFGLLRFTRRFGHDMRSVLIVGSGPRAAQIRRQIAANPHWGLRVLGHLDEVDVPISSEIDPSAIRKIIDVRWILRDQVVDEVIIATPRSMLSSIGPVVSACGEAGVPFTMPTDVFGDYLPPPRLARFGDVAALRFAAVHHNPNAIAAKRALDLVGGVAALTLAAPILAVAAVAVRLTSPGPAFFRQKRCGLYGRQFTLLKLRTMVEDAEAQKTKLAHLNEMSGPVFKIREDPRITPLGKWLRRTSIDELPQLWNVVRGDMSLVGPRPALPSEVSQYRTFERRRLSMRPGLTCLWQVSGRNQVSDFEDWVRMDLKYIDTWSLMLDFKILLQTVGTVMKATGS